MLWCLGDCTLNNISHHCADDKEREIPCLQALVFYGIYVKTSQTRCFKNTYLVLLLGFVNFFFHKIRLWTCSMEDSVQD